MSKGGWVSHTNVEMTFWRTNRFMSLLPQTWWMVQNACLEDFLFFVNNEVVQWRSMKHCYFVSFPRLKSALLWYRLSTIFCCVTLLHGSAEYFKIRSYFVSCYFDVVHAMCLSVHLFWSAQLKIGNDLMFSCPYVKYFMDVNKYERLQYWQQNIQIILY